MLVFCVEGQESCLLMIFFALVSFSLFVRLISHQPAEFFSQNKSATSNQPAVLLSEQISTSHQPPAKRTGCLFVPN
jgi:hypothetical protein